MLSDEERLQLLFLGVDVLRLFDELNGLPV